MTGNNYLLDTNIVIEVFDGNKDIADKISKFSGFYISSVILGELFVAVAKQHVLTLISKDNHFKEIDGISLKHW